MFRIWILLLITIPLWSVSNNIDIQPVSDAISIRIHSFQDQNIAQKIKAELDQINIKKASALVIDLRHNMGGFIHESMETAALFVNTTNLIELIEQDESNIMVTRPENHPYIPSKKLMILVDHMTASSGEIAAFILTKHPNAIVIGKPSHGKSKIESSTDEISPYKQYVIPNNKIIPQIITELPLTLSQGDAVRKAIAKSGIFYKPLK